MSVETIRETNNPNSLFVAACSILSLDGCLERCRGECGCIQHHFPDKITTEFRQSHQRCALSSDQDQPKPKVSIANPGNRLESRTDSNIQKILLKAYHETLSKLLEYIMNNNEWLHWYKGYGVKDVLLSEIPLHTDSVLSNHLSDRGAQGCFDTCTYDPARWTVIPWRAAICY